ncbi:MAG TPA: hypothetical protein DCY27_13340 [Desulfobacterales bacterium]|nr:hypothetical protein [Desulfobacterales bacterium]
MATGRLCPPIITLLTDFGLQDVYVGVMKGVILGINPNVRLVDLTHNVPPHDIAAGAFLLRSAWQFFPSGAIHLAVVDPGVGSDRRALAIFCRDHYFVGPDNGLFSLIFSGESAAAIVSLEKAEFFLPKVSATFHGRDIMAPTAAYISLGTPLTALGPSLTDPVALNLPAPRLEERRLLGEIIYGDRFGNLISNILFADLQIWRQGQPIGLTVNGHPIPHLVRTYHEVPSGTLLALEGSHGYLEIACRLGSAAQALHTGPGGQVVATLASSVERRPHAP